MANKAVSKQETKPSVSDFEFLHDPKDKTAKLGVGSFASVKLAKNIKTQKLHAMKIISMHPSRVTASDLHNMKTEISIHRTLNHPNIIKFYNYFQSQHDLYLVLEFAENGNLYSYLHKKRSLRQEEIFRFFYQTCLAIQYMHQNNTLHRDIKPENLLLDKDFNIKLCDFGWSARQIREKRVTFCGTYEYMAPEIIHKKSYDYRVDIWSLGVLLYELIHKEAPYKGRSLAEITKSLAKVDITFSPNAHPDAKDLIQKILKSNPDERLTIEKILSHPWIKSHLPESQTEESIIDLKEINSNIKGEKVKTGSDQKAISLIEAPIYRDEPLQKELRERNPNRIESPSENLNKQRVMSEKSFKDKPASSIPAAPFNKLFINLDENGREDSERNKVFENNLASPLLKIKGKSFIHQISVPQTTTNKLRMEISSLFSSRTPSHNSSQNSYNPINLTCRNQSDQTSNFPNYSSKFDLRIGQNQKSGSLYLSGQQTYRVNGQENMQQAIPLQNPEIFKSSVLENKLGEMYSKTKTNQFEINTDFVRNKENQDIIKEERMINWGL